MLLADVAAWQAGLTPADVVRAGFGAVNLKIGHGLTRRSVHPDVTGWVDRCRQLGLGISTFHFLDGSAPGADQAHFAFERLAELGLTAGTAHQVDCEATAGLPVLRDYLATMIQLLGRPVAVYSGDWWWQPRGWDVTDLSPYLWSAPAAGYLTGYPGDDSLHWDGYGGWDQLSVMQFAVSPLTFPDGTTGSVRVSKSAIRDPAVWSALTGGGSMSWGGLNPALTSWRNGIIARFPKRGTQSDGGYADELHGSTSQHQADPDGTVDAFDCDVNVLGSSTEQGTALERRFCEALKADFAADARSQLWIHQEQIANRDLGPWKVRGYDGSNPHDKHIHFQSRQALEGDGRPWAMVHTDALLDELEDDMDDATIAKIAKAVAEFRVEVDPDRKAGDQGKAPLQPWARVDGYGSMERRQLKTALAALAAQVRELTGRDFVDEQAVVAGVLAGLDPAVIAAAVPQDIARQVADELTARLQS